MCLLEADEESCAELRCDADTGELEGSADGSDEGPGAVVGALLILVGLLDDDEEGFAETLGD